MDEIVHLLVGLLDIPIVGDIIGTIWRIIWIVLFPISLAIGWRKLLRKRGDTLTSKRRAPGDRRDNGGLRKPPQSREEDARGNRILIIEDDETLSHLMRLQLEHAGYQVTVCLDGKSGIQAARESDPDMILLDILLPDMDGWVAFEQLKQITDAPIVISAALGSERDAIRVLELGAADCLIKPFTHKELLTCVKAVLHRVERAAGSLPGGLATPVEQDVMPPGGLGTPVEQVARTKAATRWAPGATRPLHYDLGTSVGQDVVTVEIGRLSEGTLLENRYRINRILSYGDFSVVYLARDMRFTRELRLCAIKEMLNTATDPMISRMIMLNFERQANILAALSHPVIPQIYDYFKAGNRVYIVLEYIEGRDSRVILRETEGFLPEERIVSWAIGICDALHYLHTYRPNPIVHRDVKPQHVLVDLYDKAHLLGFTIARLLLQRTKVTLIGTEGYAPPEQYRGRAGPWTDIYALGATIHHLLSKQDPTLNVPFSFHERPIHETNPTVSRGLTEIIDQALDYDITKRFGSAEEMRLALLALLYPGDTPPARTAIRY